MSTEQFVFICCVNKRSNNKIDKPDVFLLVCVCIAVSVSRCSCPYRLPLRERINRANAHHIGGPAFHQNHRGVSIIICCVWFFSSSLHSNRPFKFSLSRIASRYANANTFQPQIYFYFEINSLVFKQHFLEFYCF